MTVFHDFVVFIAGIVGIRKRTSLRNWSPLPPPPPREDDAIARLRDDQLRLYLSSYGQSLLRRELERRKGGGYR